MPTTDDYGQGINIASLTDAPNAETLAKDIVNAIASRSVMRFSSASARAALFDGSPAPVEGMQTWLQDANRMEIYDGTTWVASATGQNAWTTVPLASGFSHNGNSNGTFQYRVVNLFGEVSLMLQGAVNVTYSGSNIPNGGVLNTTALPSAARPTSLRTIVVPCSDVTSSRITLKLDVQTNGYLKIYGTGSGMTPPWIGFNGCFTSL